MRTPSRVLTVAAFLFIIIIFYDDDVYAYYFYCRYIIIYDALLSEKLQLHNIIIIIMWHRELYLSEPLFRKTTMTIWQIIIISTMYTFNILSTRAAWFRISIIILCARIEILGIRTRPADLNAKPYITFWRIIDKSYRRA